MTPQREQILVRLEQIEDDRSLAWRDALSSWRGGEALLASVQRRGVLTPITLRPAVEGWHRPAAGFRRIEAARALGLELIPAHVDDAEPAELFLSAVEEHAGRSCNLRERARAVAIAAELLASAPDRDEQLVQRLLPALGLHPSARLVEQHLRFAALAPALADLLLDKAFSLRRCLPYCDLSAGEAEALARLGRAHRLGGRRLEQAFTWALEVARRDDLTVEDVVEALDLAAQDGQALQRLEARRLPATSRRRQALDTLVLQLQERGVTARYDRNLGSDALELLVAVRESSALEGALAPLSDQGVRALVRELVEQLGA